MTDLTQAGRALRKAPGFALAVISTLALAIGANTSVFSVVNAVLIRALPYDEPDRLIWIASIDSPGRTDGPFSLPEFLDYRDQTRTLDALLAYASLSAIVTGVGPAERLQGMRLSAGAFEVFGVNPAAGRLLVQADDEADAARVAVLGYGLWQRRFGGDPRSIGRTMTLNGEPHEIVGVLPRDFSLPLRDIELVVPLAPQRDPLQSVRSSVNFLRLIGQLAPKTTMDQARDELTTISQQLRQQFPDAYATKLGVAMTPLHDQLVTNYRRSLWLLLGGVLLVLAVAAANLVNLLLARALARRREIGIRVALGASGWAIARQLLMEASLLCGAGGIAGMLLAYWGLEVLVGIGPADLPRLQETSLDWRVLAYATSLSVGTAMALTLIPLWHLRRDRSHPQFDPVRDGMPEVRSAGLRNAVVVSEMALAVVLLLSSALLLNSLIRLQMANPGFETSGSAIARISLPRTSYSTSSAMRRFVERFEDGLRALPGVQAVGGGNIAPLSGVLASVQFAIVGRPPLASRDIPSAQFRMVTAGYFAAMGVPILQGRPFARDDTGESRPVAIVNRHIKEQFFADEDPIGRQLLIDDNTTAPRAVEIVGVAGNVKQVRLDGDATFDIYVPMTQAHPDVLQWLANNQFWAVRVAGNPRAVTDSIRKTLDAVDPTVGLASVRAADDYLGAATAGRRFTTWLLAGFAMTAFVLALVGLYAVIAYAVGERTRELGLRMAIGASGLSVTWLILRQACGLLTIGTLLGLALTRIVSPLVAGLLFETSPYEARIFVLVLSGLVLTGLVAALVPARRACRVDPLVALRSE